MSFVVIAAGSTHGSRIRTLSMRSLLIATGISALGMLALGLGLGYWLSMQVGTTTGATAPQIARAALPFAVEQLGALSARLFNLESQAGQLSERIGAMQSGAPKRAPVEHARAVGSGGPLLPARFEQDAVDNLDILQARMLVLEQRMALVSDAAALQNLDLMRMPTHLPIRGAELVSVFGNRDDPMTGHRAFHAGLDFAATIGTPILAAAGGTVSYAGLRPDFGWVVEIEHGNGLTTRYAHASRVLVSVGNVVEPGDPIAQVGSTGRSTGPHLHFEVLRRGEATDPKAYLAGL